MENETKTESLKTVLDEMHIFKCRNLKTNKLEGCKAIQAYFANRIETAVKRETKELKKALVRAYDTLYSISCSRYGKGLTCTDSIHEVVQSAKKCVDELDENKVVRETIEYREK